MLLSARVFFMCLFACLVYKILYLYCIVLYCIVLYIIIGLTASGWIEKNMMHGEMVSVGLITQLLMENSIDMAKKCIYFFNDIGLPFTFSQLKLNVFDNSSNNKILVNVKERILSKEQWFRDNEPFAVTETLLVQSMQKVDKLASTMFPKIIKIISSDAAPQASSASNSNNGNDGNSSNDTDIKMDDSNSGGTKPIVFEVTGFGKFGNVLDNPTTHLIKNLSNLSEKQQNMISPNAIINSRTVLHVSGQRSVEMLKDIRSNHNKFYSKDTKVVYLHMGVAASRKDLCLETRAVNNTKFGTPDELGWAPMNEMVCKENGSRKHVYMTRLNAPKLVEILKGKEYGYNCKESTDAGLYVCNWIFYNSSHLCRGNENEYTMFVHVPLFKAIDEQTQTQFVIDLINEITKSLS